KRKLAYRIDKKYDMGYYVFTYVYTNNRDFVKNMENYFKINENVIRFLVFKQKYKFQKDKLKEKMAKKEG
ncbi:MAG TPA: 30S ribosomal protein S6, partial [Desulfurobacteriaceae bacterium]|nr:30S ribosomal protein S6 [Desulfurobacteriaceae bacterium]